MGSSRSHPYSRKLAALLLVSLPIACAHAPKGGGGSMELVTYDAEVEEQTLSAVRLKFPWELELPAGQTGEVTEIRWSIQIEGEAAQEGTATPDTPSTGALLVEATLAADADAFAARVDKSALTYVLSASFDVKTPGGSEPYESDWHGEIFPPKRLEVAVRPQAARYGSSYEFTFVLVLKNPNPFSVPCKELSYKIFVDDTEIASGAVAQGKLLANGSETEFEIQRPVGGSDLPALAKKLAGRRTIPYRVDGRLSAGGLEMPNDLTGEIQFPR